MNASPGRRIMQQPLHRLDRTAYLAALAVLQVALAIDVAPRIAVMLVPGADVATGAVWPAEAQMAAQAGAYALTIGCTAVVLAFPTLALARHVERGRTRFLGLPRTGIRLAVSGALAYLLAHALASIAAASLTVTLAGVPTLAASLATGGLALMSAGVLTAEVLRRAIAPLRVPIAPWECNPVRIEVIDPPELATRAR